MATQAGEQPGASLEQVGAAQQDFALASYYTSTNYLSQRAQNANQTHYQATAGFQHQQQHNQQQQHQQQQHNQQANSKLYYDDYAAHVAWPHQQAPADSYGAAEQRWPGYAAAYAADFAPNEPTNLNEHGGLSYKHCGYLAPADYQQRELAQVHADSFAAPTGAAYLASANQVSYEPLVGQREAAKLNEQPKRAAATTVNSEYHTSQHKAHGTSKADDGADDCEEDDDEEEDEDEDEDEEEDDDEDEDEEQVEETGQIVLIELGPKCEFANNNNNSSSSNNKKARNKRRRPAETRRSQRVYQQLASAKSRSLEALRSEQEANHNNNDNDNAEKEAESKQQLAAVYANRDYNYAWQQQQRQAPLEQQANQAPQLERWTSANYPQSPQAYNNNTNSCKQSQQQALKANNLDGAFEEQQYKLYLRSSSPTLNNFEELQAAKQAEQQLEKGNANSNSSNSNNNNNNNHEFNQLRILEMRKEKSRDAARSRRSKENHEFYELAKLLPLPAAITSQLDFLDKASIIRLTISFLKLRQFSVNGYPPWAPDFTTLGSVNPYSSQALSNFADQQQQQQSQFADESRPTSVGSGRGQQLAHPTTTNHAYSANEASLRLASPERRQANLSALSGSALLSANQQPQQQQAPPSSSVAFAGVEQAYHQAPANRDSRPGDYLINGKNLSKNSASLFDIHQGTHILQSLDGFAFAIGRDGRFLYISETVSMYLGLSQVEMTGSSVFDYAHQQDHEELAQQLGIPYTTKECIQDSSAINNCERSPPTSIHSQYSAASNETLIEDYVNPSSSSRKRAKLSQTTAQRGAYGAGRNGGRARANLRQQCSANKLTSGCVKVEAPAHGDNNNAELEEEPQESSGAKGGEMRGTTEDPLVRQFCIRMKSTLTKRGCQHFKSSGYRVVHVVAHLRSYQSNDHGHLMDPLDDPAAATATLLSSSSSPSKSSASRRRNSNKSAAAATTTTTTTTTSVNKELTTTTTTATTNINKDQLSKGSNDTNIICDITNSDEQQTATGKARIIGMVAVAIALPPPSINELRLESGTFVFRLSLDLRVTHIEPKITELLHYPVELIAGRSLYSLVHPADVSQVQKCHKDLLKKGQMMSGYYRLLARDGGYIWIQTCATLICNNNFGAQTAAPAASSPMPLPSSVSSLAPAQQIVAGQDKLMSTYLAPPPSTSSIGPIPDQYSSSSASHSQRIVSPGLSSHLSSNYDTQDQDQCVIFVNYMITDVLESNEILDICQSSSFTPLSSFSGNNTTSNSNNNNNNITFNSPASSCSSPCLSKTNASGASFGSLSTPNSSASSLSSPRRNHHPHNHHHHHHQQHHQQHHHHNSSAETKSKSQNGRRHASSGVSKMKTTQLYSGNSSAALALEENGNEIIGGLQYTDNMLEQIKNDTHQQLGANNNNNNTSLDSLAAVAVASGTNETNAPSNMAAYGYHHQVTGGVNLASTNKTNETSAWLPGAGISGNHLHSSGSSVRLNDPSALVYSSNNQSSNHHNHHHHHHHSPYSTMDRSSIYKAAFGLADVSASNYSHTHHQQATGYNHQAGGANYSTSPAMSGNATWADTAAAAAVAAASGLTSHHHVAATAATNPYVHLESHHPQSAHSLSSAASAAAAAAATSTHHHSSAANSYYSYYGYYGNKFI